MAKSMATPQEQIQDECSESENKQSENKLFDKESKSQLILCEHCRRTATNGIKCQGICVSDSSY